MTSLSTLSLGVLAGVPLLGLALYELRHIWLYWQYDPKFHVVVDYGSPVRRFPLAQLDQAMKYLEENGYVVIANVANADQVLHARSLFWDHMEQSELDIQRDNMDTWERIPAPGVGIISSIGIGQSNFLWFLRTLPGVRQSFEAIWKTNDLLVSFDGSGIFLPWQYQPAWKTHGGWFHVDQNAANKPGKVCVQGLVSLYDGNAQTGGLIVVPKSHQRFHTLTATTKKYKGDYVRIPPLHEVWGQRFFLPSFAKMVHCRAGDLILWDSRCIHCNGPAIITPKCSYEPNGRPVHELVRLVAYVCMTPATMASEDDRQSLAQKRKQAFIDGQTTTHWPHEFHPTERGDSKHHLDETDPAQQEVVRLLFGSLPRSS